jgi:AbrB family looped-hinge helix DNA binding protein
MAKVTSKLQVTIPKRLAEDYGIAPGDEIDWVAAGDVIRVVPPGAASPTGDPAQRLELFDTATRRQEERQRGGAPAKRPSDRGWRREELHVRECAD